MTLPTFLGVGVQKAGTSWLHYNLSRHPEVFVPTLRKEIHFFDRYYSKGMDWYKGFFPENANGTFKHFGEITPRYIFDPEIPERIVNDLGKIKIIVILRDPVDRFFSQYRMSFSKGDTHLRPEEFLEADTEAFERGLYARQLKRYIDCFGIDNILVLFYEDIFSDGEASAIAGLNKIGNFLGIRNDKWVLDGVSRQVGSQGSAGRPKFFGAYRLAVKFRQYCMDKDMEWLVLLGKKMGIGKKSFGSVSKTPKVNRKHKDLLWERYRNDVCELESLIGRKLDIWGPHKYG